MNLPRVIAWRYLKRPTDKLVSAVGLVSIFGLVIGVMALVISMALMTGYRRDLQKKLLGGNAEIFVYGTDTGIRDVPKTLALIRAANGVREASPVVFQHALISSERHSTGEQIMLKGIEPERAKTTPMLARIVGPRGTFAAADGGRAIAVGKYLAQKLGLQSGDAASITVPVSSGNSVLPRTETFVVTNVFDTGFYEYDARWIFMSLDDARDITGSSQPANLIEVKLQNGADLDKTVTSITNATDHRYAVTDWRQMNKQLFSMLAIQQLVLFIVIGLIVFVSTFNIVSTLIMTVHEKRREIGILTSMGAEQRLIRRIFLWYGSMVGIGGTLAGIVLGVVVCYILTTFKLISFGPEIAEVYFVSSIPFITRWQDLAAIALFAIAVSFLATVAPSMRASKLNPIDALRHE